MVTTGTLVEQCPSSVQKPKSPNFSSTWRKQKLEWPTDGPEKITVVLISKAPWKAGKYNNVTLSLRHKPSTNSCGDLSQGPAALLLLDVILLAKN